MVRPSTLCAAAFLIWACTVQPPSVHADPIQVGGSIRPSTIGTGNYQWTTLFLGGQFFFADILRPLTPAEQLCTPCSPGQMLDLSTTFSLAATGLWHTSAFELAREAFGEGELRFESTPVTVPTIADPDRTGLFGIPFPLTSTGLLRFVDVQTSEVLFEGAVFGSGTGLLFLTGGREGATPYSFGLVNYTLADPVPEPASMLLVGTGVLWLGRRHLRNRRRRESQT